MFGGLCVPSSTSIVQDITSEVHDKHLRNHHSVLVTDESNVLRQNANDTKFSS